MDWEVRAASLILCLGILLATIQNGIAEQRIVCYYTNWSVYRPGTAKFSPQNINPYLCTHLIYAFGGFTKDNALRPFDKYQDIEKGGYAKFTGLKTYNKNLKTMLAIGGWNEGSSRFSPMVADSARRREFVKNTVKFLRQNHFDGLDLDWEYPAFRDGGKPRDKDNYANLVQELREEFERESSKTGRPRLLLSMAMPAGVEYIDKGYDVPRLNEYLDFINLLSYDYHSAYEPVVNHHSPLYPLEEDNEYNYDAELTIDHTINYLLEKGASVDKIVLGIPTYGRSYTLFNQDATELGSPADGPGVEGDATREKGYLAYYEICENIAGSDEWEVVQPNANAMGPYAFRGDQWVGYDDENIVKLKARYVNEKKLGGIMFWSIDNDDFRGKCHGRPYPLIEAAKEALLTDNSRNTDKPKSIDSRKKTRIQSAQSSDSKSNYRRSSTTTSTPIATKRVSSSRPKYRNISRPKASDENQEKSKKSYDLSDEDIEGGNTVRVTEKIERPKNRNRNKTRSSTDRSSRRKQSRRKGQTRNDENEEQESLSNKLTTPEPPTTPDPGTDFKCEDEGFFPHPRDCKKYFWCLDSGPGGLGVVAHQFTCPSGLVFNKAADSCDYPRNVICPKTSKTSVVSTTKSPITAATSRTTYLHSTTTAKTESEEYDSEEDYEDEIEEEDEEEEEVKEEFKTTTVKPLIYKTLTRNRPSSTTTTTTTTTSKPSEPGKVIDIEDEEDPKVIKELIDLIKKAGGIEQLEKQLLLQDKNADTTSSSGNITPATISRSLYERVLNRQASKITSQRPVFSSSETSYVNGPGRAQFEGLDEIPEVKSLRRSQKPQYVTIERSRSPAKDNESVEEEEKEEEDDNTDVASSEEESVSHPKDDTSTHRVTPNYVNIRRTRPSTTTSRTENNVVEKEVGEEKSTRRRRPLVPSKQQDNEGTSETSTSSRNRGSNVRISEKGDDLGSADQAAEKDDSSQTTKSRYTSVQRFRSTTLKTSDDSSSVGSLTEVISKTTPPTRLEEYSEISSTIANTASSSTSPATTTSTSTEVITVISVEPPDNPSSVNPKDTIGSTTDSVKLVEDSATEILLTTVPAAVSSSSPSTTTTTTTTLGSRSTIAAVSQPRPFGFTRRRGSETTTIPSSRSKVADTKTIKLPTLKELIGSPTTYYDDRVITTPSSVVSYLLRDEVDNDISLQNVERAAKDEETGDSWLRQASKNKAKSRIPKMADVTFNKKALAVNAIQDQNKRKESSASIYLKPTTMRGIPLVDLTTSPVIRGFYVTKSEDDSTRSAMVDFTLQYTTDKFTESQTESTLIPDISTTNEIATRDNDQSEVESNTPDSSGSDQMATDEVTTVVHKSRDGPELNIPTSTVSNENNITREEKILDSSTNPSEDSGSAENLPNYEVPNIVAASDSRFSSSKRRKPFPEFAYNGTSNTYVVSTTSPTRRKIVLAVNKYHEATTPLWTGRRIVAKKRYRTTVSPIKDAVRRIESKFAHSTTSIFRNATATTPSTLTLTRKFPAITTTLVPLNITEAETIFTNLAAETTPVGPKIVPTAIPTATVISTISDNSSVIMHMSTDASTVATTSTVAVAKAPSVDTDIATTTFTIISPKVETISTTPNYLSDISTTTSAHVTINDFITESIENKSNYLTDFTSTTSEVDTTFPTNYSETTIPVSSLGDSSITTIPMNTKIETTFPSTNFSNDTTVPISEVKTTSAVTKSFVTDIPATANINTITTDFSVTTVTTPAAANAEDETTDTIENYSTVTAAIVNTHKSETDSAITSAITNAEAGTTFGATNYFESTTPFTNVHTTTTPVTTTSPITMIINDDISSAAHPTVSMTSNFIDTATTNMMATAVSTSTIIPTTDVTTSNILTSPENMNISSTTITTIDTIIDTMTTSSVTSKLPVTDTLTSSLSINIEPNILDNSDTFKTLDVTVTEDSTQTIPTFTSTKSKFSSSTNSETSSAETTAFLTQTDKSSVTPIITRTPSTFPFLITAVTTDTTTLEESKTTYFSTPSYDSIATNTIQTTASSYPPLSTQATNEESTMSKAKKNSLKEVTSNQNNINDRTTTIVYVPNLERTINKDPTILEVKSPKEVTSKSIQNQEENQMTSERNDISYRSGQKTPRRRVVNRTNNWNGWSGISQQTSYQYPRRVTSYRTQLQRPSSNISSARTREENLRRRVAQKRARVNPETIGSTIRSDENIDVQNTTGESVMYDQVKNIRRRMKVAVKRVKEKTVKEETTTLPGQETTVFLQLSTSVKNESLQGYPDNKNIEGSHKVVLKRLKPQTQENFVIEEIRSDSNSNNSIDIITNSTTVIDTNMTTTKTIIINTDDENHLHTSANNLRTGENRMKSNFEREKTRRRMRVVLKSVKPTSKEENSTEEASANSDFVTKNFRGNFSRNSHKSRRGRMRIVLQNTKLKEEPTTSEQASVKLDFTNKNSQENILNNLSASGNFTDKEKMKRRVRVVKRVLKPKSEEIEMRTEKDVNSIVSPKNIILNNLRDNTNFVDEYGKRNGRRMRVFLKSVKPKFEESNIATEETRTESTDKDLQGSFSSNPYVHENLPDEEKRKKQVVSKKTKSVEKDSITEETEDSPIIIVSVLPPGFRENREEKTRDRTNVPSKKVESKLRQKEITTEKINATGDNHESNNSSVPSKPEKEQTEQQESMATTKATTILTEEDTDRFSFETTSLRNNGSPSRKSGSGSSRIRQRKPTQPTTVPPLISTLSSHLTTHRRSRPVIGTTLSPRIDLNVFDGTESYVKSAAVEDDQKTDVSDQNIRAQEYAVTVADSPISSSNTGPLRDVEGRKISTTITPRMYSTTERTVTKYSADVRGRQRFRTKDKPATVNATARPRRPPVIDYDYYEDEVPIVVGKSFLNSKLFLTSKGTIRCLDQGNFPHPYSCKKFITCARMVNGQVIGTEYTCPDKLSFDPIGGICNWSAGLGCKE